MQKYTILFRMGSPQHVQRFICKEISTVLNMVQTANWCLCYPFCLHNTPWINNFVRYLEQAQCTLVDSNRYLIFSVCPLSCYCLPGYSRNENRCSTVRPLQPRSDVPEAQLLRLIYAVSPPYSGTYQPLQNQHQAVTWCRTYSVLATILRPISLQEHSC